MRFQSLAPAALMAAVASAQNMTNGTTGSNSSNPLQNSQLTTFYGILESYGLLNTVNDARNVTILAPSNEALMNLNSSGIDLTPGFVQALINYHTLNGTIQASSITNKSVEFPHTHLTNATYSNVTGGQVLECIRVNQTVTFFSGLKNNISVTQPDLNFTGGVIHVVDGLLTIPGNLTSTLTNANLTALAGAASALNLTSSLSSLRDVTIFAPNNDAFQNVGDALANQSTGALMNILSYHVVPNTVLYSADIGNTSVQTLGGANLTIQNDNGTYYVNDAEVVNPDILFSGGVIHVINEVLNPNNTMAHNSTASTSKGSKSSTVAGAFSGVSTKASAVPYTSNQATPTASNNAQGSATTGAAASSTGAANAMKTGAVGAAALFGGFAAIAVGL